MSQYDMFGGGALASMQKRNYLEAAESAIAQVRMLQEAVARVAPNVPLLGDMRIAVGSIWSDVVFDNVFSDVGMHEEILGSMRQVDDAGRRCGDIVRGRKGVLGGLEGEGGVAEGEGEAFRGVVGGEQTLSSGALPAYSVS
ncbi:hypothetical protein GQ44DRAFT_775939 [Phaeosphaeriaceae sp. PMI808]|nr:hypothetical protein GQ44DRAFT_775939 [Phaeosphaeriaceae sp. PMI808]